MAKHIKKGSGGARRKVDPLKGRAKLHIVSLYDAERAALIDKYKSLTKALRSLL